MKKFPREIEDFANEFVKLQIKRHDADYDPSATFARSEVLNDIVSAEAAIKKFKPAPISDRRAFVAWLVLAKRN